MSQNSWKETAFGLSLLIENGNQAMVIIFCGKCPHTLCPPSLTLIWLISEKRMADSFLILSDGDQ